MSDNKEYREDLLKLASSFLSSDKVQHAEKSKKVAFLKNKGLSDAEIEEAFKRLDQVVTTKISKTSSSSLHRMAYTAAPAISEQPLEPLIIYQPVPEALKVPTHQVFAMALVLAIGGTGIFCGIIGVVKRLLYPIFTTYAQYKHSRYKHQATIMGRLQQVLEKDIVEDNYQDDLDALSALDKPGIYHLAKQQQTLADRLAKLVSQTQSLRQSSASLASSSGLPAITSFKISELHRSLHGLAESVVAKISDQDEESDIMKDMKGQVRRLKGVFLNARHF